MKNSWLVAMREWKERVSSRSFVLLSIFGPLMVLGFIYVIFTLGGQSKQRWKVLIADPAGIMQNKIMSYEDKAISYDFADGYIEIENFAEGQRYQKYDALVEVNEKVLSNKTGFVFYRERPTVRMQTRIQYQYERRLEEVMVKQFTDFTVEKFRKIKQPIHLTFRDVYDPKGEASSLNGWAGLFFGGLIFVFIFLFGMTILRSVSKEKMNRVVEVLLASVSPNQLMMGKMIGIGLSAFLQFAVWLLLIGVGLYFMRETLFPDLLNAADMNAQQLILDANDAAYQEQFFVAKEYNVFVNLVYDEIHYTNTVGFFILFFIAGYFFYGALFAAIGSAMGSESDGQQFIIPVVILLCFSLYSGYYVLNYPDHGLSVFFHYFPFTSPVVVMVRLFQGYGPGEAYQIYIALLILIASAFLMLGTAARLYRNGILQFGHRLRLSHLFKWLLKA